jgi:hypothetical protein
LGAALAPGSELACASPAGFARTERRRALRRCQRHGGDGGDAFSIRSAPVGDACGAKKTVFGGEADTLS